MSQPSFRDAELLSVYLDGQLSRVDSARLESRMKTDPQLRSVYDELRQARVLLGRLPARRAPRNFTLTPQLAGIRPPAPAAFPFFRLASVFAAILLFAGYAINLSVPLAASLQPSAAAVAYGRGGGPGIEQSAANLPAATQAFAPDVAGASAAASAPASVPAFAPTATGPSAAAPLIAPGNAAPLAATPQAKHAETPLAPVLAPPPITEPSGQSLPVSPVWLFGLLGLVVLSGGSAVLVRGRAERNWRKANALAPARVSARDRLLFALAVLIILLLSAGLYWMAR